MQYKALKDTKSSWILFIAICIIWSTVYMTKNCFNSAMAAIVSEGIMTKTQTGIISAVFWLIYAPCQIIGGRVADRYPPSFSIIIGALGAAAANAVIYFNSRNYAVMLIAWSCNAALQFGLWPAVFKIISTQLCRELRIKCLFLVNFSLHIGLTMSYILSSIVTKWEYNFLVSCFALIITTVLFLVVYYSYETKMEYEKIEIKYEPDQAPIKHASITSLIKQSGFGFILIASFLISAISMGTKSLAPTMLMETYTNIPVSLANQLNVIIIAVSVIGAIAAKVIYPKYIKNEVVGLAFFSALAVPFLLVTVWVGKTNLLFLVASMTLGVLFITGTSPFYSSCVPARFNRFGQGATMAGLMNCLCAFGNVCATYVFTAVADNFSWTASAILWSVMSAVTFILVIVSLPMWKRFTKDIP